jgi:signal transduction histidine kinase
MPSGVSRDARPGSSSGSGVGAGRRPWRSVRVRITLAATVVTGLAVSLAGWMLVRSIEDNQLGALRRDTDDLLDEVVDRLGRGQTPDEIVQSTNLGTVFIRIAYQNGGVFSVAATGGQPVGNFQVGQVAAGGGPGPVPGQDPFGLGPGKVPKRIGLSGAGVARDELEPNADGGETLGAPMIWGYQFEQRTSTVDTPYGPATVTVGVPVDQVARTIEAVRQGLIFGLPLLVGLVALVAWRVVGRALRPVELIRAEAEAIGGSTLHRRVPEPATDDEIGRLADTMNAMLDRLDGSARRQRQFVADASHELRSPVAAIRTDLEVALSEGDGAAWPSVARAVLAEETRLETLLGDLLLLAADDESAVTVAGTTVDLTELAAQEADRTRRVPVALDAPPDAAGTEPPTVAGSRAQLERALTNLVDNAVRHADQQVRISVADVTDTGPWVQVGVDDDGPGIPVADRERVFDRFTRLDDGRARDEGGAGLGLAVVRSIATRHGGFVWAGASPLGGARFVLSLPRSAGDRPASRQEDPEPEEADLGANGSVAAVAAGTRTGAR